MSTVKDQRNYTEKHTNLAQEADGQKVMRIFPDVIRNPVGKYQQSSKPKESEENEALT